MSEAKHVAGWMCGQTRVVTLRRQTAKVWANRGYNVYELHIGDECSQQLSGLSGLKSANGHAGGASNRQDSSRTP